MIDNDPNKKKITRLNYTIHPYSIIILYTHILYIYIYKSIVSNKKKSKKDQNSFHYTFGGGLSYII